MNRIINFYAAQLLLIGLISIPSSISSSTLHENKTHQEKMRNTIATVITKQNALIAIGIGAAWYIHTLQKQVATLQKNQKDTVLVMRYVTGILQNLLQSKPINHQEEEAKINTVFQLLDRIAPTS